MRESPSLPTGTSEPDFRANLARSVRIFKSFRAEQANSRAYYSVLADDTVRQLRQYTGLNGRLVLDVGGGPGFFVRALRGAGARAFCVDADAGELAGSGRPEPGSVLGSALDLPVASERVDVTFSSNVLEHVPDPERMLAEMVRVTRPGGIVFCAFTNWLSPWGGHETSPWHYLGGERAAQIYHRRYGRAPKNRYGRSLYPFSIGEALRWARRQGNAELIDAVPRYLPGWSRPIVRLPGAREVLTWNLLVVLRRTPQGRAARSAGPTCDGRRIR
jgi:SAM-dependent methyltransferase